MKPKELISLTFTGLLVVCALLITGLVIRREFFPPESSPAKRAVENWQQLEISGQRSGPADARVRNVEFYDYQCPFCKSVQPAVKAVRRQYPDQVSIVHEHYPLGGHEFAFGAAVAAECAARQGTFERYHELLFARQDSLRTVSYVRLADEAGIKDAESFRRCVEDEETADIVESGVALGNQLEIGGIPTFLINGTLVSGVLSEQQLENLVRQTLQENPSKGSAAVFYNAFNRATSLRPSKWRAKYQN